MIWRFGKKQLSDVVKVQQFLEKECIDYELLLDHVDVQVGGSALVEDALGDASPLHPAAVAVIEDRRVKVEDSDPLWRVARHNNKLCQDKEGCKDISHYGGEVMV